MPFDYEGARQAGYSDAEIASFLGAQSGFDTSAALKSGYQPSEIIGFLSQRLAASEKQPAVEDAPVQGDPMGTGFAEIASAPANAPQAGAGRGFVNPPLASQPRPRKAVTRAVTSYLPETDVLGNATGGALPAGGFYEDTPRDASNNGRDVGIGESAVRGVLRSGSELPLLASQLAAVPIIAADAVKSLLQGKALGTDTSWQDAYFGAVVKPRQEQVDAYSPEQGERQSVLGKITEGLSAVVGDLPQMLLSGGISTEAKLAQTAPTIARFIEQAVSQGFDAMRPIMLRSGTEKAKQVLDAGGTSEQAVNSALTAALVTGFQGAQPMSASGGVLKRAATGFPVGAAQGEAARVIQNAADPASLQRPFDIENAIVSGATGALAAAGLGHQAEPSRVATVATPRDLVRDFVRPEETAAKVMGAASVDEAINTATQEAQRTSPAAEAVRAQMQAIRPLREKPEEPAAPEVIRNESGTLTVKGDPKALTKVLEGAGVTAILPAKNGVVVGKSQVELAERALAEFTGARNGLAVPPEPVRASDPGISLPERIDTARPADAVVPAQAQPVAEVPKVAAEPRVEPRPETAGREPAEVWFGRRGDGYQSILDAEAALPSRERARPDLQWMVHDRNGRYYLAGYEEQPHARDAGHVSADVAGASERGNPEPLVGVADRVGTVPARQAVGGLRAEPAQESGAVPLEPGRRADAVESIPVEGPAAAREVAGPMDAGEQVAAQVKGPRASELPDVTGKPPASWVIREKATGKTVFETYDAAKVDALNTTKYEAVPIHKYLAGVNRVIRAHGEEAANDFTAGKRPDLLETADSPSGKSTITREAGTMFARFDSALKRGDFQIPGRLSHDQAESFVAPLREKWKNGPAIHVTASNAEFPIRVPSDVRGLYYKGEVWVASDAHRDGPQAKRSILSTAAHEAVSHYGLRYMLGQEDWGTLMRQIQLAVKSGNKPLNEIRDYIREHYRNDDGSYAFEKRPLLESDEIAARAVELAIDKDGNFRPGFGMFKAVFAKVAQFLRSIGIDVKFTNAELQGMLVLAMKHLEAGHRAEGATGQVLVGAPAARAEGEGPQAARESERPAPETAEPRYARGTTAADEEAPTQDDLRAKLGRLIRVPLDMVADPVRKVQMVVFPMASGGEDARAQAKTAINQMRSVDVQWGKMDDYLKKNYSIEQQERMWRAGDEENDIQRAARLGEAPPPDAQGLAGLSDAERAAVEFLHDYSEDLKRREQDDGLLEGDGVDFWMPRVAAKMMEDGAAMQPFDSMGRGANEARNLRTSAGSFKHRGDYKNTAESEAALKARKGEDAEYVKNIRVMPLMMAQMEKALIGRRLVNQIKARGQAMGEDFIRDSDTPGYKLIHHPSLKTWKPAMDWHPVERETLDERGYEIRDGSVFNAAGRRLASYRVRGDQIEQMSPRLDEAGDPIMESQPMYIRNDWYGPLKAIFTGPLLGNENVDALYRGLMEIKSTATTSIMFSPMTHFQVIYGRALPGLLVSMGGKASVDNATTLGAYTYVLGYKLRSSNDTDHMALYRHLVEYGMVPGTGRGMNQDIEAIAHNVKPGRSLVAKAIGAAFDTVGYGDSARKAIDAAGHFWHETLLWDRIADMQAGVALQIRANLMAKGFSDADATTIAAHFSNRYAGMIPREAMSQGANALSNLLLFSKSFTLGNIGAMKDIIAGLPRDMQAQIKVRATEFALAEGRSEREAQKAGEKALSAAQATTRRKALASFALDVGAMYIITSVTQSVFASIFGSRQWDDILQGYRDRYKELVDHLSEHPWEVLYSPMGTVQRLTPGADNPKGKEDRVRVGSDEAGNTYYMRLPFGKVPEEFMKYAKPLSPEAMALYKAKTSTLVKPFAEIFGGNEDFQGRQIIDPQANTVVQIGQAVGHFLKAQFPVDVAKNAARVVSGEATPVEKAKLAGDVTGFTVSQLRGGDTVAEVSRFNREQQQKLRNVLPDVRDMVLHGKTDDALQALENIGLTPREANSIVHRIDEPSRISRSQMRKFRQHADDEEGNRLETLGR